MKAMTIDGFGLDHRMKMMEVPKPMPDADEILIELAATSINPVDWKIHEGHLKDMFPHEFPLILGWDAAGTVREVGNKVTQFKAGDKVYAYTRKPKVQWGTYAEFVTVTESAAAHMPKGSSFEDAATIPLTGLTAWQALFETMHVKKGHKILIHAGAGGVGSLAIQFAKEVGAFVFTTAGVKNHDYVKSLGADIAIDYKTQNFVDVIREKFPEGLDGVLDTMSGEIQARSFDILKPEGVLVGLVPPFDDAIAKQKGKTIKFIFVEPNGRQLKEIARLIEKGIVKPAYHEDLPLAEATKGEELSRTHHVRGKIVLKIKN